MDFTIKPTNSTPALTAEIAQLVYNKIKEHGTADMAFKSQDDSSLEPEHFKLVNTEADRIVNELNAYKNGKIITPKVLATYDESGEVLTEEVPAVHYVYTTDKDLISQVSSDLLNVTTIYNDIQ